MKTVHGWAFPDVDEFMSHEIKADGTYQASHLREALTHVTDWSIAIDGGAHVGTWSRLLSPRFTRVFAVEPSADTFEALTVNMRTYGCANVEVLNLALGRTAGFVTMVLDGRGKQLANTGARHAEPGDTVQAVPIDEWHLPSLGFLKLDVEGSEVAALEGAAETLTRCRPIVLFEDKNLWSRYGYTRHAPQQLLTGLGYRHRARAAMDEIWGPV